MWASKTKNLLMALGVSISLISMILMLSFGSGLTGYISSQAQAYSSPTNVTISKSNYDRAGNKLDGADMSMMSPKTFSNEEIEEISNDINSFLDGKKSDFIIKTSGKDKNLSYGYSSMTMSIASLTYDDGSENGKTDKIIYSYTTPPYYTEKKILSKNGHISKENEIMLSSACLEFFGVKDYDEVVGKQVSLDINFPVNNTSIKITKDVKVSAVVDVSIFSQMLVMYVDYDFLNTCIIEAQESSNLDTTGISPSLLFIETDGQKTTDLINSYIKSSRKDLSGSVEEQLVEMFNEMMSTFSIALAVIAGISLIVALIMILVVLYMSVSERTREIGVLKSIGARGKDIKLIFSTESLLIGIFSGITGVIFSAVIGGILSAILKSILGFAPIAMMWYYFVFALVISVIISVLAGLYPASKASKLDPVDALRHD